MRIFASLVLIACASLLMACGGSSGGSPPAPPAPPPGANALQRFDALWDDFDANYSFFQLKNFDWNDSRDRFRQQLATTSSDRELFNVLSAMLAELEDGHVRLETPFGTSTYTGWYDQFAENFNEPVITATYLGQGAMMSSQASLLYGLIDADIGYVRIHSLGGSGHGADIDAILADFSGVSGIVLDLRHNGGGNDQNGEAIAARFADQQRVYRGVRFRNGPNHDDFGGLLESSIAPGGNRSFQGPVAVLTNRRTFSSAESLVLAFAVLPSAFSVGDFTGGGSANPALRSLGTDWSYTVSQWVEFLPDGSTFEGVGIEPDFRVDISDVDAAMQRDTILDAAVSELRTRIAP